MSDDAAAVFDSILSRAELPEGVRLEALDERARPDIERLFARVFADTPAVPREAIYDETERARADRLMELEGERMLRHSYGFFAGDALVGAYEGRQERRAEYHMARTALLPEWRRRGIYRAFLPRVLEAAAAAGFLRVTSRHAPDNNAILIAKLSQGFVIEGMTTSLRTGLQIMLVHHTGEGARAQHRRVVRP